MISRLRDNNLSEAEVIVYKKQIQTNKSFILRFARRLLVLKIYPLKWRC